MTRSPSQHKPVSVRTRISVASWLFSPDRIATCSFLMALALATIAACIPGLAPPCIGLILILVGDHVRRYVWHLGRSSRARHVFYLASIVVGGVAWLSVTLPQLPFLIAYCRAAAWQGASLGIGLALAWLIFGAALGVLAWRQNFGRLVTLYLFPPSSGAYRRRASWRLFAPGGALLIALAMAALLGPDWRNMNTAWRMVGHWSTHPSTSCGHLATADELAAPWAALTDRAPDDEEIDALTRAVASFISALPTAEQRSTALHHALLPLHGQRASACEQLLRGHTPTPALPGLSSELARGVAAKVLPPPVGLKAGQNFGSASERHALEHTRWVDAVEDAQALSHRASTWASGQGFCEDMPGYGLMEQELALRWYALCSSGQDEATAGYRRWLTDQLRPVDGAVTVFALQPVADRSTHVQLYATERMRETFLAEHPDDLLVSTCQACRMLLGDEPAPDDTCYLHLWSLDDGFEPTWAGTVKMEPYQSRISLKGKNRTRGTIYQCNTQERKPPHWCQASKYGLLLEEEDGALRIAHLNTPTTTAQCSAAPDQLPIATGLAVEAIGDQDASELYRKRRYTCKKQPDGSFAVDCLVETPPSLVVRTGWGHEVELQRTTKKFEAPASVASLGFWIDPRALALPDSCRAGAVDLVHSPSQKAAFGWHTATPDDVETILGALGLTAPSATAAVGEGLCILSPVPMLLQDQESP